MSILFIIFLVVLLLCFADGAVKKAGGAKPKKAGSDSGKSGSTDGGGADVAGAIFARDKDNPASNMYTNYEQRLFDHLFAQGRYEKLARPVENENESVKIKFDLDLQQIVDVDEKNERITLNLWLKYEWNDWKLKWNFSDYENVMSIRVPYEMMWTPDILLYNSVDPRVDSKFPVNLVVYHTGFINWIPLGIYTSSCEINIKWFPFDDQFCSLKFGSWTYDESKINMTNKNADVTTTTYKMNGEWVLKSAKAVRNITKYDCCVEIYPDVTSTLHIKRRPMFFAINIIIPCALISGLAVIAFILPSDCGEKVGLGITILLALSVYQMLVAGLIPATSLAVPLLGVYFMCIMVMSTLSCMMTIFILKFHHTSSDMAEMSDLFRTIVCTWMAWVVRMQRPGKELSRSFILRKNTLNKPEPLPKPKSMDLSYNPLSSTGNGPSNDCCEILNEIVKELRVVTQDMKDTDESDDATNDWKFHLYFSKMESIEEVSKNLSSNLSVSGSVLDLSMIVYPNTCDNAELQYVCIQLILTTDQEYPAKSPDFCLNNPRGISDVHFDLIREEIVELCAEKRGNPVIYDIIELIKDSLTKANLPHGSCVICLDDFEEADKFLKTSCYHYFHNYCILRYIEHSITRQKQQEMENSGQPLKTKSEPQILCPVCREKLDLDPETLRDNCAKSDDLVSFVPDAHLREQQRKFAIQLEKQRRKGGIIDKEAEKKKFLILQTPPEESVNATASTNAPNNAAYISLQSNSETTRERNPNCSTSSRLNNTDGPGANPPKMDAKNHVPYFQNGGNSRRYYGRGRGRGLSKERRSENDAKVCPGDRKTTYFSGKNYSRSFDGYKEQEHPYSDKASTSSFYNRLHNNRQNDRFKARSDHDRTPEYNSVKTDDKSRTVDAQINDVTDKVRTDNPAESDSKRNNEKSDYCAQSRQHTMKYNADKVGHRGPTFVNKERKNAASNPADSKTDFCENSAEKGKPFSAGNGYRRPPRGRNRNYFGRGRGKRATETKSPIHRQLSE